MSRQLLASAERVRPVNYQYVSLLRIMVLLPMVVHILGCGLYIVADLAGDSLEFLQANLIAMDSNFLQWVYGIYWAVMTCTTIGKVALDIDRRCSCPTYVAYY
jgi:hypothetical protein